MRQHDEVAAADGSDRRNVAEEMNGSLS